MTIDASGGSFIGPVQDRLDGSYARRIAIPAGVAEPDIRVTVQGDDVYAGPLSGDDDSNRMRLLISYEDLLRRQTRLIQTFGDLIGSLDDNQDVHADALIRLLESYEDLLKMQVRLLEVFARMICDRDCDPPGPALEYDFPRLPPIQPRTPAGTNRQALRPMR